jgi:hypothetical protein
LSKIRKEKNKDSDKEKTVSCFNAAGRTELCPRYVPTGNLSEGGHFLGEYWQGTR